MSYRGVGGYYRAGDYGYSGRRGDLGGGTLSLDSGGSDIVDTGGDLATGGGGILGTGLSLPDISWSDLGNLASSGASAVSGWLQGAPAGAPLPGGAPTGGGGPASRTTKAAVRKAIKTGLRVAGLGHRRMNPLNPKAARRALRRLHGFDRIAKKILHVTSPKKRVHGFRFKKRRR